MNTGDAVPGIALEKSWLGGLMVMREGVKLGWMHERGDCWHAYQSGDGITGIFLGEFTKAEAVRAIVAAAG